MKTIRDFDLEGKRVLVRCDFNVPLDLSGAITDDFRIRQTIPTIRYAYSHKAKTILISHLGKPGGRIVEELRLTVIQNRLEALLGISVAKTQDCVGAEIDRQAARMAPGDILLLENVRFHKEEEENDREFAHKLSSLGSIFINDAFGASHRSHASIAGVPMYLPSGAGLLLEKEILALNEVMGGAKKPLVVIVGGSKVETKLRFLENILKIADWILLGNLPAQEIKQKKIRLKCEEKFVLAPDGVIYEGRDLDIGPYSLELFKEKIREAGTIFWEGPNKKPRVSRSRRREFKRVFGKIRVYRQIRPCFDRGRSNACVFGGREIARDRSAVNNRNK
ncbi:MAG: phosphoglycerate kinase [Candidatus Wildermuthbacteria bacterium]|nr:phosphoglycerate kinase [Candidatus Wildermuthbacteria bacterium]